MSETPAAPRLAETFEEVEDALLSRWPETRLEPSLDRIQAFTELLGDPQRAYRLIHLTGTNGKTSTSRMIDTLLRALELRTGRFTSPHVERMTERISQGRVRLWEVDGEPVHVTGFNAPSFGVARVGPVYTPREHRGRGYASAGVAGVSRELLDRGARACLFTDQANPTSNRNYQALGYRAVVDMANFVIGRGCMSRR